MKQTAIADHNSVLLIGGPDAGKSNFLFRLWIAIDHGGGALVKDGLPSELEYLRGGAEQLLEGEFAGHTSEEVHERVIVPVRSSALAAAPGGIMVVPDVAGEQVLAICRTRQWSRAWEELISPRCACLLFVRAGSDEVVAPLDWATCFEKYGAVIDAPDSELAAGATDPMGPNDSQTDDEKATQTPTQVVLTEWLQFLRRAFTAVAGGSFRPRVGMVISAWDAVPVDQQPAGPVPYLKDNFPMLHQFIEANKDRFDFQLFGVSIVDGDLKNDEQFKETYLNGRPQDFGVVVHSLSGQLTQSSDITLPVAWALRLLPDMS
jgi:hypothetical protein